MEYIGDFIFDVIVEKPEPSVMEVLSFATAAITWTNVEHDAGHFLYALERVKQKGVAVVQPPSDASHQSAVSSHDRVLRWFSKAGADAVQPRELAAH